MAPKTWPEFWVAIQAQSASPIESRKVRRHKAHVLWAAYKRGTEKSGTSRSYRAKPGKVGR